MIKKLAFYALGIYIVGMLLTGVTYAVVGFAPYFIVGMLLTIPVYGEVRSRTGKSIKFSKVSNFVSKKVKNLVKVNKKSISAYLVVFIVVSNTYEIIGDLLIQGTAVALITIAISFVLWEGTRFIAKKTKKFELSTYGEAVKGAF